MGLVGIGGLAVSTLLTLLIVPVAYTLMDDAQTAVMRWVGIQRSLPATPPD
jgi:Cu/Ag efflux pump CusA